MLGVLAGSAVVVALLVFYMIKKKSDPLNPFNLFLMIISSTVFITSLQLSSLQHTLKPEFIALIALSVLFFWIGTRVKINFTSKSASSRVVLPVKFTIATDVLFSLIVGSFLLTVYVLGPPPLFSGADRVSYYLPGVESITLLSFLMVYVLLYDRFSNRNIGRFKFNAYMLTTLLIVLTKINKMTILFIIYEVIFMHHFMKKKITFKRMLLYSLFVITLFILAYTFLYGDYYNIDLESRIDVNGFKLSGALGHLVDPYMYLVCNFENLQNYMFNSNHVYTYGHGLLRPLLDIAGMNSSSPADVDWKNSLQYPWLTTGTFFREVFYDFSYAGFVIVPAIFGFISSSAYKMFNKSRDILGGMIYLFMSFGILLSFFTNIFTQKIYIVNIIFGLIFIKYTTRHSSNSPKRKKHHE